MPTINDKVSIIIPLYNRELYIVETLGSAIAQTYPNVEIIVVDDGSTDNSLGVISSLVDKYNIAVYQHENGINKGQAAALNLGLSHATGEFIQILDSDDVILPRKLELQVSYLEDKPEVGMVYGMGIAIDSEGRELYDILSPQHVENSDPNDILLDPYMLLQGALIRASALKKIGSFNEGLRAAQDHDVMVRLFEVTHVAFQAETVFLYRRHGDSISSKGLETRWRCGRIILNNAVARYPYKKNTIRKRSAIIHFRLAQALLKAKKNYIEAISHLAMAALLDPLRALKVIIKLEKIT